MVKSTMHLKRGGSLDAVCGKVSDSGSDRLKATEIERFKGKTRASMACDESEQETGSNRDVKKNRKEKVRLKMRSG